MSLKSRKNMSTSAWILIAIAIICVIALPILHFTYHSVGFGVDLSFIGTAFTNILIWASESTLNGVLLVGGVFIGGALTWHALKTYILGTTISVSTVATARP